jgi:hypothetical protein
LKRVESVKATVVIWLLPLIACVACDSYSLRSDQKAKDAVLILQKLNARVETGISYRDYSAALGEANFPAKQFLEGGHADANAVFSQSLRNAIKWYKAAGGIWSRQLQAPIPVGYCAAGLAEFEASDLCTEYAELVTTVAGKPPSSGNSVGYAVAAQHFNALMLGFSKTQEGSPGVIYELATHESWKRAAFEVRNAQHALNSEPLEKASDTSFKVDREAERNYQIAEARKSNEIR